MFSSLFHIRSESFKSICKKDLMYLIVESSKCNNNISAITWKKIDTSSTINTVRKWVRVNPWIRGLDTFQYITSYGILALVLIVLCSIKMRIGDFFSLFQMLSTIKLLCLFYFNPAYSQIHPVLYIHVSDYDFGVLHTQGNE